MKNAAKNLKQLVKAVLPATVLRTALNWRDSARLQLAPRDAFELKNLRALSTADVQAMLHDTSVQAAWAADHQAIAALYGAEDKYGGVNPGDRRALYYLAAALKPQRVLEVGTHIAASTLYLASALKSFVNDGRITTVDILDVNDPRTGVWPAVGLPKAPRDFAADLGVGAQIEFVAQPCLDFMNGSTTTYDLIFLDGDHRPHAVYHEVAAALQKLSPQGVIVLHDYYPTGQALFPDDNVIVGPWQALARVRREQPALQIIPLGDLPWETKQGVRVTSLALLTKA